MISHTYVKLPEGNTPRLFEDKLMATYGKMMYYMTLGYVTMTSWMTAQKNRSVFFVTYDVGTPYKASDGDHPPIVHIIDVPNSHCLVD